MGGQDQWGYGQQQPPQQQQPQGWGTPPQSPGSVPGAPQPGGRPKLSPMQILAICAAFVLVLGGAAGAAFAVQNQKKNVENTANAEPTKSPKAVKSPTKSALPKAPSQSPSESPSPSASETDSTKNNVTAKERGTISLNKKPTVLGTRIKMGGPTIVRVKAEEGADCGAVVHPKSPKYKAIFKQYGCLKYVRGAYVSEKKDVYLSTTILQFPDAEKMKAAKEKLNFKADAVVQYVRPPSTYDWSQIGDKTIVATSWRDTSEVLVITQSIYKDGRAAASSDLQDLYDYNKLSNGDVTVSLAFGAIDKKS
jgi:hypothetical protein